MTYCVNCGAAVDGHFCPKCGTPVAGGATPGGGYPHPHPAQGIGMEENLAAALCYIPIIGPIVFLFIEPYKNSRTIRFHAWQSLLFTVASIVIRIGMAILFGIMRAILPDGTWALFALLSSLVSLGLFAI